MTKKDYELIARVLKMEYETATNYYGAEERMAIQSIARRFARKLKATNPRFNTDKFLAACGITQTDNDK